MYSLRFLALAALLAVLVACGQATNDVAASFGAVANVPHDHAAEGSDSHEHASASGTTQAVLATSEIVTGPNRLAFGVLDDNVPIKDAEQTIVKARFYSLDGNNATLQSEETATYYGEGLGPRGTFVVTPSFATAGAWGVELDIQRPSQPLITQRLQLNVVASGSAMRVGQAAPRSKTPTAAEVRDLTTITSATAPDPRLYQLSVEQAVTNGKPSLVLFATPGYCQTAVCGPGVDVLSRLADTFGDRVNTVHVEVYQLPYQDGKVVPAMTEWGLQTEPWLFMVDSTGVITGRYEGGITLTELEPAVRKLAQ